MNAIPSKVVQEVYAAFAARDLPRILGLLAADVEIVQSGELPWGGNYTGQVGDGTSAIRFAPVLIPGLSGVVSIAAVVMKTS